MAPKRPRKTETLSQPVTAVDSLDVSFLVTVLLLCVLLM